MYPGQAQQIWNRLGPKTRSLGQILEKPCKHSTGFILNHSWSDFEIAWKFMLVMFLVLRFDSKYPVFAYLKQMHLGEHLRAISWRSYCFRIFISTLVRKTQPGSTFTV